MTLEARTELKAILFADLVSYSRLVGAHEAETLALVQECFVCFRALCDDYGGRLVKTTGDGVLIEFDSASAAVGYGIAIHRAIAELQREHPLKAEFRIGVHMGEIQHVGGDIYGHAVNVAARIEPLARPGGVCISQEVYRHARRTTPYGFVARGAQRLKNIAEPVSLYDVVAEPQPMLPATRDERLAVRVIDGLAVSSAEDEPVPLRSRTTRALLGYLSLSSRLLETPERLATLLFPNLQGDSARRALAGCGRNARAALEKVAAGALVRRGDLWGLEPVLVDVDVRQLHQHAATGEIDQLLLDRSDWADSILQGLEGVGSLFRSWLEVARHSWRSRLAEALEACLDRFEPADAGMRRAASALLRLEPSHERAAQQLIRHHAATGNLGLALRTFEDLRQVLDERFGIAPGPDTQALVDELRRSRTPVVSAARRAVPVRLPRIGLGSSAMDHDTPTLDYLVQGFRAELLTNLARFRDWAVLEMGQQSPAPAEQEGTLNRPDYVLSARSHAAGDGLEILVTLVEQATGRIVWGERFQLSIASWFDAQRAVVRRVAAHVGVYVSADRLSRTIAADEAATSVYDAWLRGEHLLTFWTPETEDEAQAIFEDIIARRPDFAPAYASLASIHNVRHVIRPGLKRDADESRAAFALARKAVELDPLDARNQLAVAWIAALAGEFDQATIHLDLADTLNPNDVKTQVSCAMGYAFFGDHARAVRLLDRAEAIAPALLPYQWCYAASVRFLAGDYERAVEAARRGGDKIVDNQGWLAASLAMLGRQEEARATFARLHAAIAGTWAGDSPPSAPDIVEWFRGAYPIRGAGDRHHAADAVGTVVVLPPSHQMVSADVAWS